MNALVPCPACRRHVRVAESACPFCQAALPASIAQAALPPAPRRMKRAAAFAFSATLAVTGCGTSGGTDGGTTDTGGTDAAVADTGSDVPADDGAINALYGGPPRDGGFDVGPGPDAGLSDVPQDDGGLVAAYGGPPDAFGTVDTGTPGDAAPPGDAAADVPGDVHDGGGAMALYGAPPSDGGGGGVRYGAPPPRDI